jgi:transcriptional regulator of acetoin/glycerol metabolism
MRQHSHGASLKSAAETAGVDRTYLYRLIKRHDL